MDSLLAIQGEVPFHDYGNVYTGGADYILHTHTHTQKLLIYAVYYSVLIKTSLWHDIIVIIFIL